MTRLGTYQPFRPGSSNVRGCQDPTIEAVSLFPLLKEKLWPGSVKRPNHLSISAGLMNQVTMAALELDLILIGQVHSHSPLASTDLSYPDRYLGITERGYLSVVAPEFAQNPATRLAHCGVHVHEGEAGWRRMAAAEISSRFELPDLTPRAPLVIGGPA